MENTRSDDFGTSTVQKDKRKTNPFLQFLRKNRLLMLTLFGVLVGFVLGFGLREVEPSNDAIMWLGMPGEVFMRTLTAMILPLIISNVIAGSASLDVKSNGKLGLATLIYVVSTNIIAAAIGIFLAIAIRPGSDVAYKEDTTRNEIKKMMDTQDLFADLIRNMFPSNIVEATFKQAQTRYEEITTHVNFSGEIRNNTELKKVIDSVGGTNILGLITFSFIFGIAASSVKDKGRPFKMFFESTSHIMTKVLTYLFLLSPIGVASLIAASVISIPSVSTLFTSLGVFTATVTAGLFIHMFILIPISYVIIFRRNPFVFLFSCIRPCIVGFTLTSGSAAIPEIEYCLVEKNKVDRRVARVILPLTVTLNADGSALFIVTATMFIANYQGVDLNVGNVIAIGFLTAISTMALPGIPSSSIVTLILLLSSLNISPQPVAMLYAVEWFLDRIRTSCNVLSHVYGCLVVFHFCKSSLSTVNPAVKDIDNHEDDDNYDINDNDDGEYDEMTTVTPTITPTDEESHVPYETNGLLPNGNVIATDSPV